MVSFTCSSSLFILPRWLLAARATSDPKFVLPSDLQSWTPDMVDSLPPQLSLLEDSQPEKSTSPIFI
eukprot:c38394_g1_i1 orf=114-314(-)